jgi:predicted hydrocarbon binding protein
VQGFDWLDIGDIMQGRPHLGQHMDVAVYRLMQYTLRGVLADRFGDADAAELFREAGRRAGRAYCRQFLDLTKQPADFVAQLRKQLVEDRIGILQVEKSDFANLTFVFSVAEDLDCSGLPIKGGVVCEYDEGFIAGILQEYTGKTFLVREIDCWANGSRVCRFDIKCVE